MEDPKSNNNNPNFRLSSPSEVVAFFKNQICEINADNDVDLTLISIILGFIEKQLTTCRTYEKIKSIAKEKNENEFPVIDSDIIIPLVEDFRGYIRKEVLLSETKDETGITERQTIKDVAAAIWKNLDKSFHQDKPHYQTLYSFKNGCHLDSFGLAYAVAAGCQILDCQDVHLCLSEEHAWISFGSDSKKETAEITWHGKQNEKFRGDKIESPKSWLYLGEKPVLCKTRRLEATAAIAMINPFIDQKNSSQILMLLQRDLLWMLYDAGLMSQYPMALCVLADLQEKCPDNDRPNAGEIYHQAIECSRLIYGDNHVYPHSQYGCYLYRMRQYDQALYRWQQAANVLRKYYNNREEEELYKEIVTIAQDLIPKSFKAIADSGSFSFFQNKDNLTNLLLFYDGICEWEQNSTTPVLYYGWVKPFIQTMSYFPANVRGSVLSPINAVDDKSLVIPAPLPRSPIKNIQAYHRFLLVTAWNIYGDGTPFEDIELDRTDDDLIRLCETSKLNVDLVRVGGSSQSVTPIESRLEFRSRKMEALRSVLAKNVIRANDVELHFWAHLEPTGAATCGVNDGRRTSERKKKKIGL